MIELLEDIVGLSSAELGDETTFTVFALMLALFFIMYILDGFVSIIKNFWK